MGLGGGRKFISTLPLMEQSSLGLSIKMWKKFRDLVRIFFVCTTKNIGERRPFLKANYGGTTLSPFCQWQWDWRALVLALKYEKLQRSQRDFHLYIIWNIAQRRDFYEQIMSGWGTSLCISSPFHQWWRDWQNLLWALKYENVSEIKEGFSSLYYQKYWWEEKAFFLIVNYGEKVCRTLLQCR